MHIRQKIKDFNTNQLHLNNNLLSLQNDFDNYIKDKNIPLMERWQVFIDAPDDLSTQLDSFPNFHYKELGSGLEFFMDNLLVEEHINALQGGSNTLHLKNIICNYYDEEKNEISVDMVRFSLENKNYTDEQISQSILQLLEDILQINLVTFDFAT